MLAAVLSQRCKATTSTVYGPLAPMFALKESELHYARTCVNIGASGICSASRKDLYRSSQYAARALRCNHPHHACRQEMQEIHSFLSRFVWYGTLG